MEKKLCTFLLALAIFTAVFTSAVAASFSTYGGYWPETSLTYYVPASISSSYGSAIRTAIVNGIESWSGISAVTLSESTSASHDIGAYMNYYGNTGWDGYTTISPDTISEYTFAKIQLNTYTYSSYISSSYANLWRALACHEAGHALGIAHSSASDTSVMCNGTENYYQINGTKKIYKPQTQDRKAIQSIYGS